MQLSGITPNMTNVNNRQNMAFGAKIDPKWVELAREGVKTERQAIKLKMSIKNIERMGDAETEIFCNIGSNQKKKAASDCLVFVNPSVTDSFCSAGVLPLKSKGNSYYNLLVGLTPARVIKGENSMMENTLKSRFRNKKDAMAQELAPGLGINLLQRLENILKKH